ncbi:MAG: hypothetical protein NZ769_00030 [Anaerolineae bacterium]|nr:hypothetical protein [Anaerolineae bacterium]
MLGPRLRSALTYVTLATVATVLISAMASILLGALRPSGAPSALLLEPAEVNLCPGDTVRFAAPFPVSRWAATGGTIGPDGVYTAGERLGNYEARAVGTGGERGYAYIHVVLCTPTPPPTPTPLPTPTPVPTPTPTPVPEADPAGDLTVYLSGAAANAPFNGLDIRNAPLAPDGRLDLQAPLPFPDLAAWVQAGEQVFWVTLQAPIPETLPVRADWFFVLDLDGNPQTGRPPGTRPANRGLGDEVAVGVYYDPTVGGFRSYLLLWNAARREFADGGEPRFWVSPDRTTLAVAVPLETLRARGFVPEAARGRAIALAYVTPEPVADFYPER